jgi:hypothetical protein
MKTSDKEYEPFKKQISLIAELEMLKDKYNELGKAHVDLVGIAEQLREENKELLTLGAIEAGKAMKEVEFLREQNVRMRECLDFYADKDSYDFCSDDTLGKLDDLSEVEKIGDYYWAGKRARVLLKELDNDQ